MVIGKMKDETSGKIMCEIVGLRAKMYSFKVYDPEKDTFETMKKAKGIQKAAIKKLTHEQYLEQLHNPEENHVTVRRIGQVLHTVLTFEQQKRALCAFDDKRYLLGDCIHTLAHGHCKIRSGQDQCDDPEMHPGHQQGVLTDEDGDEHLVVTQCAVQQSPILQQLFENGERDDSDEPPQRTATAGDVTTTLKRPSAGIVDASTTLKRPCTHEQQQQAVVAVVVDDDQLTNAKNSLCKRFNDLEFQIAETLITTALAGLDNPTSSIDTLNAALQKRDDVVAKRALDILGQARKSNKMTGLSDEEQLLFVVVKSTKVFHRPYSKNPHKSLFMLLTGRSANWWDNNHQRMLRSICSLPRM